MNLFVRNGRINRVAGTVAPVPAHTPRSMRVRTLSIGVTVGILHTFRPSFSHKGLSPLDVTLKEPMRLLFFIVAVSLTALGLAQEQVAEPARWIPARPDKIAFRSPGTAQILDDHSVQLGGDPRWQEFTLYFEFRKPTRLQEIRVELLPPTSSADPNRPRQSKRLVLFEVKPQLETRLGQMTSMEFSSCVYLGDSDDESTANCIDSLTDTGWTVPAFTQSVPSHQLALRFEKPVTLDGKHRMALTFDSGGSPELDVLSRLRVSFVANKHDKSK